MATILSMLYPYGYSVCESAAAGAIDELGILCLDDATPAPFTGIASASDTLIVRGWAIDVLRETPAAGIIITLGAVCSEARYGVVRRDVAEHFKKTALCVSGFHGSITPSGSELGRQELRVFAVAADGHSLFPVSNSIAVTIVAATAKISIQTPLRAGFATYQIDRGEGQQIRRGDVLEVAGWAFDHAVPGPVRGAFLVVDGCNLVHGAVGLSRPDVASYLRDPDRRSSGFVIRFDTLGLAPGIHRLRIGFLSANGEVQESFNLDTLEILQQ